MPRFHLVLDTETAIIMAQDAQPQAPYTDARTHPELFSSLVNIWCNPLTTTIEFNAAVAVFAARLNRAPLVRDVASAVQQLQQYSGKTGCGYIALGGSPKLVKWALKAHGFTVCTVNASKVTEGTKRTPQFETYLERKLSKLGTPATYVVMDFADTGASLRQIKKDVSDLRPHARVLAVAVGNSPGFLAESKPEFRAGIDHVLTGIPDLTKALHEQTLKFYVLGRNKQKNDYATWNDTQSTQLDTTKTAGNKLPNNALFQQQKVLMPKVLMLPEVTVKFDDLFDETAGSDADDNDSLSGSFDEFI
jgi:hypothetical protein